MTGQGTPYDLVSMGRTGVDIYPLDHGVGLEDGKTCEKFLGGSATNVAVAAARDGRHTALVTRTGADPFGRYVRLEVDRLGVDPAFVTAHDGPPTPVTFCEVFPPDDFPLYFYRYPTAPDLQLEVADLPLDAIRGAQVFWSTVTGLSQEPSRATHFAAFEQCPKGVLAATVDERVEVPPFPVEVVNGLGRVVPEHRPVVEIEDGVG